MSDWLRANFGEVGIAHGLSVDGNLLEIFVGPDGTFTAVKITPLGHACIVDFGNGWQMQRVEVGPAAL